MLNLAKSKTENQFSKSEPEIQNFWNQKIETRFSKSDLQNEIRKRNTKFKSEIQNSKIDFPKTKSKICDFEKFKNRFENSESVLERMIYKNALKKKTNHNFEKMITQDDL